MLKKLTKSEKGFTIIEVMIVLAIAGLILLIVFLAVPALQRNQRNTQRKNDVSHAASLISEWESNNGGKAPTKIVFSGGVGATEVDATSEKFSILDTTTNTSAPVTTFISAGIPATDFLLVYSKAICTNNTVQAGSSARQLAVLYYLEGSTKTGCIQV